MAYLCLVFKAVLDTHDSCTLCVLRWKVCRDTYMDVPPSITDASKEKQKYVSIYGRHTHVDSRLSYTSVLFCHNAEAGWSGGTQSSVELSRT